MLYALKAPLRLKDGTGFQVGAPFKITVQEERPTVAILEHGAITFKIRSLSLHKYFKGFKNPAGVLKGAYMDGGEYDSGACYSLAGERVEPDGWDAKGFPSIYLAAGLV